MEEERKREGEREAEEEEEEEEDEQQVVVLVVECTEMEGGGMECRKIGSEWANEPEG